MSKTKLKSLLSLLAIGLVFFTLGPAVTSANHSWNGFHWARTSNPFNLKLGDNLSTNWDVYLNTASSDWSQSSILDTQIVSGGTNSRRCRPTLGRVEVCNYRYGNNGWLGLAQIWISGEHITQGIVKANDTYFNKTKYNTPAWKNLVLCQEVGHTLGLDHQDEIFDNLPLGTCMDYSNDPAPNQHPNDHDFEQLESIYAHLDSTTTVSQSTSQISGENELNNRSDWGRQIKNNGRAALYVRDFGGGKQVITSIILVR